MNKVNITPIGGLEEIGKNCLILEDDQHSIMIDCGLKFSDDHQFGTQFEIPDFNHLKKKKMIALLITHGHLDHIGAVSYLLQDFSTHIYGSSFTLEMLKKQLNSRQIKNNQFTVLKENKIEKIGNFYIEPFNVNHSIIESFGFIIDLKTKGKSKIIHTGDFNLDHKPYKRKITSLKTLKQHKNDILLLLSDSTNSVQKNNYIDEKKVFTELEKIFQEYKKKNKIVITTFSTQIPRILKIFEISKKYNRKIFLSGLSIVENYKILIKKTEYQFLRNQVIDQKELKNHKKVTIIASGTQGEKKASIFRMSEGNHKIFKLDQNDLVLFSSSIIPGNEKEVFKIWNNFSKNEIEYLTPLERSIHTSGHSAGKELETIIQFCNPEYFIPIHGESRHLKEHKKIAVLNKIKKNNIFILENGQKIEIESNKIKIGKKINLTQQIISNHYQKMNHNLIKERKEIASSGIIFIQIFKTKDLHIKIQSYGVFIPEEKKDEMNKIDQFLKQIILDQKIKLEKKSFIILKRQLDSYFKEKKISSPQIIINFN